LASGDAGADHGAPAAPPVVAPPEVVTITTLADELMAHLRETSGYVRMASGLPVSSIDDLTAERAQRESEFHRAALKRLEAVNLADLRGEPWLLAKLLRHTFQTGAWAAEDYWFDFVVTPYGGGFLVNTVHQVIRAQAVGNAAERANYLHLLDEYATLVEQMAAKTKAQAKRGIRVPKPALTGVRTMLSGLRDSCATALDVPPSRLTAATTEDAAAFRAGIASRLEGRITPAYDRLLAVFDAAYTAAAPTTVGISQYSGGKENYLRRITNDTGLALTPQEIHERGLTAVADLDAKMKKVRDGIGFKGDREAFHDVLRHDARFFAKTPQDLEARYLQHLARLEPQIPRYFSQLPKAPYGVKRLDPAAEAGMTFGYYQQPTPAEATGFYLYNGSSLDQRPIIMAAHLIYHELVPGHHVHMALQAENKHVHPVREFLFFGAFSEGWAEYAASLAVEMGALDDPYDRYGHLLTQAFLASRLVVDTGMNYFGWPLEQARRYMREHTFLSDGEIATETLRYSTDFFAQALNYRLGYEQFWSLRRRAEARLGDRFDIHQFHIAVVGSGAMPLDVLAEQVERFIQVQETQGR
jgi:uncharacterized protein (DUF885 family)